MPVRVMVKATIRPADRDRFEAAYLQVTEAVRGTAGHLGDSLLRDTEDESTYVLLAEWESEAAFRAWEDDPRHREMAAPMFPYWADGGIERRIFEVRATLDSAATSQPIG